MTAPASPAAKSKKLALPSYLSNIRNAQAQLDREFKPFLSPAVSAADRKATRPQAPAGATRPQAPSGGLSSSTSGRSTINRNPSKWSASIQNFGQRFGDQWRKRRRKKGSGNVAVPQAFYVSVACFFFAFPLFFVLFILARHAVFGDESMTVTSRHEVPAHTSDAVVASDPSPIEFIEDLVGLNDHAKTVPVEGRIGADGSDSSNSQVENADPNSDSTKNESTALPKQADASIAETASIVSSETMKDAVGSSNATYPLETVKANRTQVIPNATIQLDEMDKAQILSEQKKMAFGKLDEVAAEVSSSSSKLDEKDSAKESSNVDPSKADTKTKSRVRSNKNSRREENKGERRRILRGTSVR